jgi:hypothetical protein
LLLENVALKLLFGNRLARSAKSALTNGLCAKALTSDLTLTRNVGHCLLDHGLLKRVHVRHGCARSQARNACAGRLEAKGRRFLQLALRFGCRCTSAFGCNVCASDATLCRCFNTSGSALKSRPTGIDYTGDLASQGPSFAQRSLERRDTFFSQAFCALQKRPPRTYALPRKIKGALLVSHEPRNLLPGKSICCCIKP